MKTTLNFPKTALLAATCCLWSFITFAQDGSLDLSFNNDGKLTTDFGTHGKAFSVAIQTDGKIVVAGYSDNDGNYDFALLRYNTDGTLDSTFDSNGKLTTDFDSTDDFAYSLAIQTDGKIVVAGGSGSDFALVRYNTDGSLDSNFDSDGKLTTDMGSNDDFAWSVAIQTDGKIVVAGYSDNGANTDFALVRYNTDGGLDNTFDNDGKLTIDFDSTDDQAYSVAIQADDKIVAAGKSGSDFALVRYNTNGSLDNTFDSDGKLTTDIGNSDGYARSVAIQTDGKIVVAGSSDNDGNYDFALLRYNTDGTLDSTFNSNGKLTTDFDSRDDYATSVALQTDGKIVVAGGSSSGPNYDFALIRYNTDGSLDNSFDGDGKVTTDILTMSFDIGEAVVIQTDGKIVVAGYVLSFDQISSDIALARYNGSSASGIYTYEQQKNEVTIYPNPFSTQAILQSDVDLNNATLTIYNIEGQQVKQIGNNSGQSVTIKRGNLPSGIYLVNGTDAGKTILREKIIITDK